MTHSDQTSNKGNHLPPLDTMDPPFLGGPEVVGIAFSAIWVLGAVALMVLMPEEANLAVWDQTLLTVMAVTLPLALMWVGILALRATRQIRAETQRLHGAIDGLRHSYLSHAQQAAAAGNESQLIKKLEEIVESTRKTETVIATFQSSRTQAPSRPAIPVEASELASADQGMLALESPSDETAAPLPAAQFIRALNFPETAEDREGFDALRAALGDRKSAQVVQASQDVLTLLSQDGIYMDDLRPDRARPEVWRQFAQGARGRAVAPLGGVRDRSSLALTSARLKQDPVFRDAAHHFLRKFDTMITEFEAEATDSELTDLGDTRTARAFMLLGRVAGTFD